MFNYNILLQNFVMIFHYNILLMIFYYIIFIYQYFPLGCGAFLTASCSVKIYQHTSLIMRTRDDILGVFQMH